MQMVDNTPCDLKSKGFIPMKDPGFYTVRVHVVGGHMQTDWLAALARLAEQYGRGQVHLTTRQGLEIPYVHSDHIFALQEGLESVGLRVGGCGPRVRTVTACPGLRCRHGLVDAQALAQTLMARVQHRLLPHKFKICVAGCPNGCPKPSENDFGIQAAVTRTFDETLCRSCGLCVKECKSPGALQLADQSLIVRDHLCHSCGKCAQVCPFGAFNAQLPSFAVSVGGKMGRSPKPAQRLPFLIPSEEALACVLDSTLDWYTQNGRSKERFGDTLERLGLENLIAFLEPRLKHDVPSAPSHCIGPMCSSQNAAQ